MAFLNTPLGVSPQFNLTSALQPNMMNGMGLSLGPNYQFGGSPKPGGQTNQQQGMGFNIPTLELVFNTLGSLGGLWNANQANRLARDQFDYTRRVTDKNLENQTQAYNTTLEDRIRSRMVAEGRPMTEGEAYLQQHRLTR